MLQLLTATGARPEAFALSERWMARQTYDGAVRWIIVDDGPEPQPVTFARPGWEMIAIRPEQLWQPGENTQARNLLLGLDAVDARHPLVIWEDDDYYAADWLTQCVSWLRRAELVGEARSRYYNVATRIARPLPNASHASLCCTAMRGGALKTFRRVCQTRARFIDLELWRTHGSRRLFGGHRVVGIKGLPGRLGIGVGHKAAFSGQSDPDGAILRQWIGEDAEVYL